ncbi:MAG TPA: MaoC family dehydratase N-terminal domain-containing protein [Anaeromyxobacter sp.]
MPIDHRHLGRRYGPYAFGVGLQQVKDFAAATGGGVPGHVFSAPPDRAHPLTWDDDAARAGPHGGVVASPAFATTFAIEPFARACADPELGLNVLRLVHGEQDLELLEPIRPGDALTTHGEITRIQERGNLDFLEVTTTTTNQHGRVVVRGVWTAIVRN